MKSGAPACTGATGESLVYGATAYTGTACVVKPRSHWSRPVTKPPSGSVPWELPNRQKASTGRQTPGKDRTGLSGVGRQSERRSTDHRSRCGAEQPGPAVRRGDAAAIHDQCERHHSPETQLVPCRPFTGPLLHLGSRGEWLTIRAIDKRTMTSSSDHISLKH
jgi:hypothetical protein